MTKKQKATAAWAVVIIAFIGGWAIATAQNKVPPIIDVIMSEFNVGEAQAGWLTSVFTLCGLIMAIPASFLVNKLGTKKVGIVALGCAALGSAIGAFSGSIGMLMVTRVIEGIGVGLISVAGPNLISEWFPPEKRGLPMGLWGTWMGCSQTLLFLTGGMIAAKWNWQGVWWFCVIFAVIALILYMIKVDDPPEGVPNYAAAELNADVKMGEGFKSASTWLICIIFVCVAICAFGFATYISLYWSRTFYNGDMNTSNLWVTVLYAIEIFTSIAAGVVIDRIKVKNRHWVGTIACILYAVILFFSFRMQNSSLVVLYCILFPCIEGFVITTIWTVAPSTAKKPALAAVAIAILNVGLNAGTLAGPPLVGTVIEKSGFHAAVVPMVAAAIIAAVIFVFLKTYDNEDEGQQLAS